MRLLVGQLLPSFFILWYDLPTNSLTNYPTNNCISWIWMRKKIGLKVDVEKMARNGRKTAIREGGWGRFLPEMIFASV